MFPLLEPESSLCGIIVDQAIWPLVKPCRKQFIWPRTMETILFIYIKFVKIKGKEHFFSLPENTNLFFQKHIYIIYYLLKNI